MNNAPESGTGFLARAGIAVKVLFVLVGMAIIAIAGMTIYNAVRISRGLPSTSLLGPAVTTDQTPAPVDGKTGSVITAASVPIGAGLNHGIQFWMYIKDWDYKFGQEKVILKRTDSTNSALVNPRISLGETDNSLKVTVSLYPNSPGSASSSTPAPSNSSGISDDVFTCTVENVPLQSWFAVSVTIFQRNVDVYINGRLVKSCVLPGVPKPALGDIALAPNGGFSGSICNVHSYPNALSPDDALAFYNAGTPCASLPDQKSFTSTPTLKLFGYTFTFGVIDSSGKEINKYTF